MYIYIYRERERDRYICVCVWLCACSKNDEFWMVWILKMLVDDLVLYFEAYPSQDISTATMGWQCTRISKSVCFCGWTMHPSPILTLGGSSILDLCLASIVAGCHATLPVNYISSSLFWVYCSQFLSGMIIQVQIGLIWKSSTSKYQWFNTSSRFGTGHASPSFPWQQAPGPRPPPAAAPCGRCHGEHRRRRWERLGFG